MGGGKVPYCAAIVRRDSVAVLDSPGSGPCLGGADGTERVRLNS